MAEQEGLTVKKSQNFSEWYTQLIEKADLADVRYNVQGFIVHKPWSFRIIREITKMFEYELEKTGHEPVLFPIVIPEENLKKEGKHFTGFAPDVFWVTEKGITGEKLEKKLALRPTSETSFYSMYSLWIRSHRDLPVKMYQSVSVYRHEPVTRPFLRGREFLWIEAHDAFETHEEALKQISEDVENMRKIIWEKLGIPIIFFNRPSWDRFVGADESYAADTLLPDGKILQVGTTHDLGQRFSIPFGIKFLDKDEQENFVWQTSYGPGIWRIFAALISIHSDDKGLVIPFSIAPLQIVIVPIFYSEKDRKLVNKKCQKLKKQLEKKYRVEIDSREKTPGEKFNDSELKGIPLRIEIGSKEVKGNFATLSRRDVGAREKIKDKELVEKIENVGEEILKNLKKKSMEEFNRKISSAKTKNDFFKILDAGGIARANFCGRENCAKEIQNFTKGAKVRGTLFDKKERALGKCIYCNREAKEVVYIAKQY